MVWLLTLCAATIAAVTPLLAQPAESTLTPWTQGNLVPFSLDALSGDRHDLAADRGHAVLVHFFATWCEPCRAEMTALQRFAERTAGKPVTILAIDVGEVDLRVRRFFAAQPVTFSILLDRDRALVKSWQVDALPTTIVLDRTLTPRFVVAGDFDWDQPAADRMLDDLTKTESSEEPPLAPARTRSAIRENDR